MVLENLVNDIYVIPLILWNQKVHCRIHNSAPMDPALILSDPFPYINFLQNDYSTLKAIHVSTSRHHTVKPYGATCFWHETGIGDSFTPRALIPYNNFLDRNQHGSDGKEEQILLGIESRPLASVQIHYLMSNPVSCIATKFSYSKQSARKSLQMTYILPVSNI